MVVARALLADVDVLAVDRLFAFLDRRRSARVLAALQDWARAGGVPGLPVRRRVIKDEGKRQVAGYQQRTRASEAPKACCCRWLRCPRWMLIL